MYAGLYRVTPKKWKLDVWLTRPPSAEGAPRRSAVVAFAWLGYMAIIGGGSKEPPIEETKTSIEVE